MAFIYIITRKYWSVEPGFLIDIDRNMRVLYSWRWYRKNTVLYYEHDWENINTRVSDRDSYRLR
ncbi:hypothetical protein RhiirB3_120091 [Rhizophagus irregularis]|nr:hypothetical protein RhiirB3_120091 [Rhizophagus irregularis]